MQNVGKYTIHGSYGLCGLGFFGLFSQLVFFYGFYHGKSKCAPGQAPFRGICFLHLPSIEHAYPSISPTSPRTVK